jgi:peptidoglycan hydrolase-like protein with peptidoglycan-binding domain
VRFLALGLIAALCGATLPAQTAPKRSSKKKTASSTTSSASKKTSASNKTASKKKTAVVRRVAQQQPTPERYKEIQQALADKGYFHGPVDGAWGADSTDALKRFQREQNLEEDGKIGSLSLIALGLGPQRGTASSLPARGTTTPPVPPDPLP